MSTRHVPTPRVVLSQPSPASFTTAYADWLVRVHAPLLNRINALDWQALTPATRAALQAASTRLDALQQHRYTTADAMAFLTELTRTLDAMNGGRS